jgi:hypothetical protein
MNRERSNHNTKEALRPRRQYVIGGPSIRTRRQAVYKSPDMVMVILGIRS